MLISVLMPVYNEEKFIKEAIDSVLSQDCEYSLELCIVDDISTDNTFNYIKYNYANEKRVKIYKNPNKGKNNAFNYAYKKANGDFFILFAGDDTLEPKSLGQRINPLKDKAEPSITLCKLRMFSEDKKYDNIVTPKDPSKGSLSGGCMAINKAFADIVFPIPEILGNEDIWIVNHVKFLNNVSTIHVPTVGINYRIHPNNSQPRLSSFEQRSRSMHHRAIAHSVFLEKYKDSMNKKDISKLNAMVTAENLRYKEDTLSLLFVSGLDFSTKVKVVVYSNKFLYWIRMKFFSLFSGKG